MTELLLEVGQYSCERPARHQDERGYDRPPQALTRQLPPSRKICHLSAHQARGQGKDMLGPTDPGIDLGCWPCPCAEVWLVSQHQSAPYAGHLCHEEGEAQQELLGYNRSHL